ncbi:MAG: hypothetical protein V8S22_06900 [Lachnospiraceae bacterium]
MIPGKEEKAEDHHDLWRRAGQWLCGTLIFPAAVCVSDGFQQKYGIKPGDTITLKEPYGSRTYEFQVGGFYDYPGHWSSL